MATRYEIQGRTVEMPAVVRDASSATALFLVPSDAAQKLIPGDAFRVVEIMPGQAQAVIGFVDYRDNDLGDYNEVMIVFFVRPASDPNAPEGTFIYKLPVNQSFTCEAGCRIWGFPKSIETIQVAYATDTVSCTLEMAGKRVFSLTLPRLAADPASDADLEMTTYTYLDGRPTKLAFTQGGATAINPGGAGAVLELGDHPIADELRGLGIEGAMPMLTTWVEHMRGTFGAPHPV